MTLAVRKGCMSSPRFVDLRRDFDRPNTFAVRFSLVQFGSLWFNMASFDIIHFENKYDYPDN